MTSSRPTPTPRWPPICRRDKAALDACGDKFGIAKRYTSYEDLLKDPNIDAVHINSPIAEHAAQSIAALKAGKHVACTVPMATNVEDCRTIVDLQKKTGKVYMMMETVVYSREYLFAKELYDKGVLGKIQFIRGSHQQDMDGWPGYWPGLPADVVRDALRQPVPGGAGRPGEGDQRAGRERGVPWFRADRGGHDQDLQQPIRSGVGDVQDQGNSDVAAEVTRSLFDVARQYRESFDVTGSRASFEWQQVEGENPVIHFKGLPERRDSQASEGSGLRRPAPGPDPEVHRRDPRRHAPELRAGRGSWREPSALGASSSSRRASGNRPRCRTRRPARTGPWSASAPTSRP